MLDHEALQELAHNGRVDLYLVEGLPVWEASRIPRHQIAIDRIRQSIQPGAGCAGYHLYNAWLRLGARTLISPDIAIYPVVPPAADVALTIVPVAVVEVLHPDYVAKDRALVPVYLAAGVLDIILFNEETGGIMHYSMKLARELISPQTIVLTCGCQITIG
jgi:hypothetical protein